MPRVVIVINLHLMIHVFLYRFPLILMLDGRVHNSTLMFAVVVVAEVNLAFTVINSQLMEILLHHGVMVGGIIHIVTIQTHVVLMM